MVCARCGAIAPGVSTPAGESDAGGFDEDRGEFLCGQCLAEQESCGCTDEAPCEE